MLNSMVFASGDPGLLHLLGDSGIVFLVVNTAKTTLVLLLAYGISAAACRASASTRHLIWMLAMVGALALPVLPVVLPTWRLPLPLLAQSRASLAAATPIAASVRPITRFAAMPPAGRLNPRDISGLLRAQPAFPGSGLPIIARLIFWIWFAGFVLLVARFVAGAGWILLAIRKGQWLEQGEALAILTEVKGGLGVKNPVKLVLSERITVPMAWGFLRPAILLPPAAQAWEDDRLRTVLAHELAHLKRRDGLTQAMAWLASAFYWFHPLVWWSFRKLGKEREIACDNCVLAMGACAADYAQQLMDLAQSLNLGNGRWSMGLAMARKPDLEKRIIAVLDWRANRGHATRRGAIFAVLAMVVLLAPLASLRGFSDGSPGSKTGKIWGIVYDPSGARVPGAIVTATNMDTRSKQAVQTNQEGEFKLPQIPAGRYRLEIMKPGFGVFDRPDLVLKAGGESRVDILLQPGQVVESVDVVGKAPAKTSVGAGQYEFQGHQTQVAPKRIRVGGDIQATNLINRVTPVYPKDALQKGIQGTVLLKAVILKSGRVNSLTVINEPPFELARAALDAVRQWRYRPTLLNGDPIEVVTTITVNFKLER